MQRAGYVAGGCLGRGSIGPLEKYVLFVRKKKVSIRDLESPAALVDVIEAKEDRDDSPALTATKRKSSIQSDGTQPYLHNECSGIPLYA